MLIGDFGDGNGSILPLTPQGVQGGQVATGGMLPAGMAFDSNGNLFIANEQGDGSGTGSVSGFTSGLTALSGSPFSGVAATPLVTPEIVATDAQNNVWVMDFSPSPPSDVVYIT